MCGYQTPNWVISFDPNGGAGTMPVMEVTPGASALLPGCSFRAPDGMAFMAWLINGEEYPASASVTPDGHLTAQAVWGENTWSLLQGQINSAEDGQTVVLTADLAASASDGTLAVPEGKRITLDLYGHTLSGSGVLGVVLNVEGGAELTLTDTAGGGALTRGMWYGIYVKRSSLSMQDVEISACGAGLQVYGTVVMAGGAIRNCTSEGGVVVYSPGSFTMTGGSVTGNEAYYYGGGGVTVNGGTFRMTGGSITRNTGKYGGGVYVQTGAGHFIMEGGSITGNTSQYAGGVYVSSSCRRQRHPLRQRVYHGQHRRGRCGGQPCAREKQQWQLHPYQHVSWFHRGSRQRDDQTGQFQRYRPHTRLYDRPERSQRRRLCQRQHGLHRRPEQRRRSLLHRPVCPGYTGFRDPVRNA
ncbi:MAG: hypothetical protein IKO00_06650 [Oscillospiraceae bacterium]|nr:hypothetical protein [Oscillospiraceae bacterium]